MMFVADGYPSCRYIETNGRSICDAPEACDACIFRNCTTREEVKAAYDKWLSEVNEW